MRDEGGGGGGGPLHPQTDEEGTHAAKPPHCCVVDL